MVVLSAVVAALSWLFYQMVRPMLLPLFLAQAAAPHLRTSRGCIVNIVDIHAEFPLTNYAVYVAAKGGLVQRSSGSGGWTS